MAKNTHLTLSDRIAIEVGLRERKSFSAIAVELGKDPTTISKEVRTHINLKQAGGYNPCVIHKDCKPYGDLCHPCKFTYGKPCYSCYRARCFEACPDFLQAQCSKLNKPPYVCNGCQQRQCNNYGIDSPEWYQPYANEIGRKIREQRKRKGMSQTQLANVMGTDRNSISRMESGVRAFRMDTLGLLHLTLSVPVTVLLPEEWMAGTLEAECMKLTEEQRAVVQSAVMGVIKALKTKMT